MDSETASQEDTTSAETKPDIWEGVPPGCGSPRPWWPLWLGLIGFVVWVGLLLVLLVIRLRTSVV